MGTIRLTRIEDIPAIWKIYTYYVSNTICTPIIITPTIDEMTRQHGKILDQNLPHFVAEENGSVVGYAYCNYFGSDPSGRFSATSSIYIDKDVCGRGYGRQLLNAILNGAELFGFRKLLAYISDTTNRRSIRLHQSAGFTQAGIYKFCTCKFNQWLELIVMERSIGLGDTTPPPE